MINKSKKILALIMLSTVLGVVSGCSDNFLFTKSDTAFHFTVTADSGQHRAKFQHMECSPKTVPIKVRV